MWEVPTQLRVFSKVLEYLWMWRCVGDHNVPASYLLQLLLPPCVFLFFLSPFFSCLRFYHLSFHCSLCVCLFFIFLTSSLLFFFSVLFAALFVFLFTSVGSCFVFLVLYLGFNFFSSLCPSLFLMLHFFFQVFSIFTCPFITLGWVSLPS